MATARKKTTTKKTKSLSAKSAKNYVTLEWGPLCSSRQTTNVRVRNRHRTRKIRVTFKVCISVGFPPPGCSNYGATLAAGKASRYYCGNRASITKAEFKS